MDLYLMDQKWSLDTVVWRFLDGYLKKIKRFGGCGCVYEEEEEDKEDGYGESTRRYLFENLLFIGSSGPRCSPARKWKLLASENDLWSSLFEKRWGIDRAIFYAPTDSKSWKDVYAVQDRCDRVGLGLKIIREGDDYFLIHQGEIQRHLGSRTLQLGTDDVSTSSVARYTGDELTSRNDRQMGILDRILFFIGDLETASAPAKRGRLL